MREKHQESISDPSPPALLHTVPQPQQGTSKSQSWLRCPMPPQGLAKIQVSWNLAVSPPAFVSNAPSHGDRSPTYHSGTFSPVGRGQTNSSPHNRAMYPMLRAKTWGVPRTYRVFPQLLLKWRASLTSARVPGNCKGIKASVNNKQPSSDTPLTTWLGRASLLYTVPAKWLKSAANAHKGNSVTTHCHITLTQKDNLSLKKYRQ